MSQNISTEQDDMIHTNWKLSRNDIMSLKSKGIFIKKGKWSPSEDRLLRQNMEDYLQQHRISDPSVLLFAHKEADKEEGRRWKQFASNTGFYKQLAKGLCREVFLVYRRARRIYDQDNYKGQFSEEEIKELIRLHGIYGNDWRKIGDIMGRSAQSVDHRFQLLEGNKGNWTDEEVDCLIEGVRAVSGTVQGEPCYNQIYWNAVASYVKTRNPTQCRAKWLNGTLWKDASSKPLKWTEKDDYELISKVYYSSVTTECDIDWHAIAEDFQHARSPAFLQHRWWLVKMRYCGKDIIKDRDFEELLDFLYNVKGESLRVKHFKVCEKATNSL
ncbi:predicted protein [Nematostella vectensis]|uniref:Cyclin-D-binding Myb-like transcription factor 1 n=1 Tax=Nematostella vectensis TaxID=45351 RepID=A7RST1_NEMVE|nr:predicted protein [Nematostella vectensis]|eukprot:XP_001637579.1 predicted protein [Nematostella vectensis]